MYRGDFQNILGKQRPLLLFGKFYSTKVIGRGPRTRQAKFGDIFQESIKQKIRSLLQYASNSRNELI